MKKGIIFIPILFMSNILSGCLALSDQKVRTILEPTSEQIIIGTIASDYYAENKKWPSSMKDIEKYALENSDLYPQIDFDNYADATLNILPDRKLEIEFKLTGHPVYKDGEIKITVSPADKKSTIPVRSIKE